MLYVSMIFTLYTGDDYTKLCLFGRIYEGEVNPAATRGNNVKFLGFATACKMG